MLAVSDQLPWLGKREGAIFMTTCQRMPMKTERICCVVLSVTMYSKSDMTMYSKSYD